MTLIIPDGLVVVLPALVVRRHDLALTYEGIVLSQKIPVIVTEVSVDPTYPAHISPAPRADNTCRFRSRSASLNFEPERFLSPELRLPLHIYPRELVYNRNSFFVGPNCYDFHPNNLGG